MPEHEDLALARGKAAKYRPDTSVLLPPDGFLLGGGAGAGRLVGIELDAVTAPPTPPARPPPIPTDVHRHPGDPGFPVVGRRRLERARHPQEHVVDGVGRLVGVGEQEPGQSKDPLPVRPVEGVERRGDAGGRIHPQF